MKMFFAHYWIEDRGGNLTPLLEVGLILLALIIATASFTKENLLGAGQSGAAAITTTDQDANLLKLSQSNEVWLGDRIVDIHSEPSDVMTLLADEPFAPMVSQANGAASDEISARVIEEARRAGAPRGTPTAGI